MAFIFCSLINSFQYSFQLRKKNDSLKPINLQETAKVYF